MFYVTCDHLLSCTGNVHRAYSSGDSTCGVCHLLSVAYSSGESSLLYRVQAVHPAMRENAIHLAVTWHAGPFLYGSNDAVSCRRGY